ncbi:hypothetical protein DSO57_1013936 [Entomophthora muscae]|uniref:Uncharacterized protein n=1 Tax=Entomophthora muscae TaxID=34485 RepID=A0ACC2RKC0_9FUNG|nr:hypothetical protein DSO57_1013936 [Entomophthora muscae]
MSTHEFPTSEGIPLLATSNVTIPPGSQVILDSQISYELPEQTFLELYSPPLLGCNEPYLCPGILDFSHKDPVQLLVVSKLQALPVSKVPTKQVCDLQSNYQVTQRQTRKSAQITKSNNMNR